MRALPSAVLSFALVGCGTILGASGDEDPPANPNGDAGDAAFADSPTSADGGSSTDAGCDARCVVLRDDFERSTADVIGPWSRVMGLTQLAAPTSLGTGQGLIATVGAGVGDPPRESFLEKTFAPLRGVELSFNVAVTESGSYGPDFLDYCEVASLVLGSKRIILVYRDGTADYLWVYGPNEANGKFGPTNGRWLSGRIKMRATWTTSSLTATISRDGVDVTSVTNALDPSAADAEGAIRVGLRCYGTTPDAVVQADDVEILTPP